MNRIVLCYSLYTHTQSSVDIWAIGVDTDRTDIYKQNCIMLLIIHTHTVLCRYMGNRGLAVGGCHCRVSIQGSVLQRVAACCSVLQRVAACCSVWSGVLLLETAIAVFPFKVVCCSVLQRVAVCCGMWIGVLLLETATAVLPFKVACCSVLQCVNRCLADGDCLCRVSIHTHTYTHTRTLRHAHTHTCKEVPTIHSGAKSTHQ